MHPKDSLKNSADHVEEYGTIIAMLSGNCSEQQG